MQRREKRRRTRPLRGRFVWIPASELRALVEEARVVAGMASGGRGRQAPNLAAPGRSRDGSISI
jgi:hypothetical protein